METLDRLLFRDPDLRATARGWQVRRPRRFVRVYRDPRWDLVSPCTVCRGEGTLGAQECPNCGGSGRVVARPAETAVLP